MDNLVASYMKDDGEHDAEITRTTLEMQSANRSILELIQQLGPYLTSKEVAARIKACTFLGRILSNLPDSYLSTKELSHIAEFLCARLQDHYTLQPSVLTCLQKISSSVNLDKNNAEYIIDSMFKEIHTQSCLQSDRYKVFQILSSIFDNHKSMIISKGRDFIYNYVQAIDGEQDPRNLLVIFQLSSDLVREGIHLGSMVEEFFEVASCYFPIDFDPSAAGKKSTITNQDLVAGLRRVIASSEEFAKYWIPLCLEKMESDIESAKLDAILTLIECLPLYSKSSLESFLSSIWSRLRQEITHVVSQDVEKNALNLLTELVRTLSQWPLDSSSKAITDLQSFLSEVLNDCLPRLEEPIQDKFTWMSGLMLLACAKGSPKGCSQITTAVIALLVKRAKKLQMEDLSSTASVPLPLMPSGIHSIIEYMVKIMSVCSSFSFEVDQNPLAPFYKDIMIIFISVLSEKRSVSAKCIAVAGIASLLSFNLLKREDLVEIADCFFSFFTGDVDLKLSKEILSASGYFASKYPHVVKSHLLPRVFTVVSENDLISEPIKSVKKTFTVLCALSTHFNTLQEVVSYVIDLVKKCKIDDQNSEFLAECLDCMLQITKISTLSQESMEYLSLHVVLPLIRKSIEASMQLTVPGQCCTRCDSIEDVSVDCVSLPFVKTAAVIVRNICQKQKSGKTADSIVETISGLYLNKNVAAFGITLSDVSINFEPFSSDFSPVQTRTVCFVTSSICSFDVTVQVPRAEEFMNQLLDLALQSTDQPTYVSAAKSFAGLLNKHHKTDEIVEKVLSRCRECLQPPKADKNNKLNALTLLIWTTKALVLCNHAKSKPSLRDLLEFLNDDEVGEIASAGFDIILRDSEEVLNSESHAVIRMMYRQRFFLLVLPELIAGFNAARTEPKEKAESSKKKANHLTALSHLLLHIPKQVLLQEFPSLLPLLIHSLHSEDCHLLHSVLSALYYLIQDASDLMEGHIDSLLNDFLKLACFRSDLKVRLKAVQCIGASTLLSATSLLPLKRRVIKSLSKVLDDPKRDVRSEAAKARSEWYLVGA